ncbi:MAG: hypothetical protein RLZZ253_3370, partial [Verrucomicrobiota bacterium]
MVLVLSMTAGVWVDDGGLVEATARRDGAVVTLAPE